MEWFDAWECKYYTFRKSGAKYLRIDPKPAPATFIEVLWNIQAGKSYNNFSSK